MKKRGRNQYIQSVQFMHHKLPAVSQCHLRLNWDLNSDLGEEYVTIVQMWPPMPQKNYVRCSKWGGGGGHGGRVVTLSPPTSEIGVCFPTRPQVGKLVVACCWSAVYSTEP